MGRISDSVIEKIIYSSNIVDVISEFVPLKKTGKNFMGVCPFHGDKGPSLSVSPEKGVYHCFGCGASGNVVGFVMRIRNMDFIEAIKLLGERAGIQLEEETSERTRRTDKLKDAIYNINIAAARYFFANINGNNEANNYLKKRNLDIQTIKKFGLGFSLNSWDSLLKYLKSKGYSEELILKSGLILKNDRGGYYDRFRNRLMFPVFDVKGRVIGFGGRVLDNSKPKYLNSPETLVFYKGTNLYGLNFVLKNNSPNSLIIVEGYMDCIALHMAGITNAVASLGTALTLEQGKLIKRYCSDVYICYDADSAGKAATLKGLSVLEDCGLRVKIISIPRGKDPDEFIKENGKEEFLNLINKSLSVTDYRIVMAKEGKNLKEVRDKSNFVKEVAEILGSLKSEIEIHAYVSRIYDETAIDPQVILDEIKRNKEGNIKKEYNNTEKRYNIKDGNNYKIEAGYKKAERKLLNYIVNNKDLFNLVSKKISPDEFITDCYKIAAKDIFSLDGEVTASKLLLKFTDESDISDVAAIFNDVVVPEKINTIIDDYINTIKRRNIEEKINELTLLIKMHEEKSNIGKSAELTQQLIELNKQRGLF